MSAIVLTADGPAPVIRVLFTLHPGFDTLDFAGPFEVLSDALHSPKDSKTKAFKCTIAAAEEHTVSTQGCSVRAHMNFKEAHDSLDDFDVLMIPGGTVEPIVQSNAEPMGLIKAFAELHKTNPSKERTLMSVCTGSLMLAKLGLLQGMGATTHPAHYTKFEILCQEAARKGNMEQTDLMEERYVVNNARFDLGANEDENPFILKKRPDGRRKSIARKGSDAFKDSRRRESIVRRANLRLAGMRVITSGGVTTGLDASLYLVSAMVSHDSAESVARELQYNWNKGVTVDAIDV